MHHALLISEISREICGALDQPSLPVVARTCRALHDPALDELWRDLYSIYPFMHLLTKASPAESPQTSAQCLTSQQWTTLRKYSERTRSLYIWCMTTDSTYSDLLPCFSHPPDPESFFPNLHTIAWYPDNHMAMLPFLRLLCGPALTSLSAEFAADLASVALASSLGIICPNITDISISALSQSYDLTNALSTSICHWKDLKRVLCKSCDDFTVSAMEHLGQATDLESLTACASVNILSFSHSFTDQKLFLPCLQYLDLHTGLLSTPTTCLKSLRLPVLKRFSYATDETLSSSSYLRDMFATLAEACSHAHLAELYVYFAYSRIPSSNSVITIRDVRPLFSFTNLRTLLLDGLSTFALDDDALAELASAWPSIETLKLSRYGDHLAAPLPTLRSLFHFTRSCPKLTALSLVMDTTKWASLSPPDMHACDVRSEALHYLCLGNSPISSPLVVAHLLRALYPTLKQVDLRVWRKEPLNHLPLQGQCESFWKMVNVKLRGFTI